MDAFDEARPRPGRLLAHHTCVRLSQSHTLDDSNASVGACWGVCGRPGSCYRLSPLLL